MTFSELSPATLRLLASRIEASHTVEQIIYRETELDEVWRIADIDLAQARARGGADRRQELAAVAKLVHSAHDLLGQNEDVAGAAAALRQAASLAGAGATFDGGEPQQPA